MSSILTYDVYYTYLNPELKERREATRALFFATVGTKNGRFDVMEMQTLFDKLVKVGFFPNTLSSDDMVSRGWIPLLLLAVLFGMLLHSDRK